MILYIFNRAVRSNAVVHDRPGALGQGVGLDASLYEVRRLCCTSQRAPTLAVEIRRGEQGVLGIVKSLVVTLDG